MSRFDPLLATISHRQDGSTGFAEGCQRTCQGSRGVTSAPAFRSAAKGHRGRAARFRWPCERFQTILGRPTTSHGGLRSMATLQGKTLFITGASRGIGKAIGLRAARDGANVVIAAKSNVPNPKLPGTIHSAAEEIEAAGGKALAIACDVREEDEVRAAVAK